MSAPAPAMLEAITREYARVGASLPGAADIRVVKARATAFERLRARGLPDTRLETWKYTDIKPMAAHDFGFAGPPSDAAAIDDQLAATTFTAHTLVFVDGWLDGRRSDLKALPAGVEVLSVADQLADSRKQPAGGATTRIDDGFEWLSNAFLGAGAQVRIGQGVVLDRPLHLQFVRSAAATMCHPRISIICGANARATIVETFVSPDGTLAFTNAVAEIAVGSHAQLTHHRIQIEGSDAFHVGRTFVDLAQDAVYTATTIANGARLARHDIDVVCREPGATCAIKGLYVAAANQHVDCHLNVDHAAARTRSDAYFKGILAGRARGVFNGRILVQKHAQQIVAQLTNRNLLLSKQAEVDTKPELEIYADDVRCAHGATIGQLDDQALFYLRSRGIPLALARSMLTAAFLDDILQSITIESLRTRLASRLLEHLPDAPSTSTPESAP